MKTQISGKTLFGVLQVVAIVLLAGCAVTPTQAPKVQAIPVFPAPPDEARFIYERTLYTSADVVKDQKHASLKRRLTGEVRSGEGLGKPYGVAVYHGRVYVSDIQLRSVAVFDIPGGGFSASVATILASW